MQAISAQMLLVLEETHPTRGAADKVADQLALS